MSLRQKARHTLPCQRWQRWERSTLESTQQQVWRLQHFDLPPVDPTNRSLSFLPSCVAPDWPEGGWEVVVLGRTGVELFNLKALIEWKCYESSDLFRESLSFWFNPLCLHEDSRGGPQMLEGSAHETECWGRQETYCTMLPSQRTGFSLSFGWATSCQLLFLYGS